MSLHLLTLTLCFFSWEQIFWTLSEMGLRLRPSSPAPHEHRRRGSPTWGSLFHLQKEEGLSDNPTACHFLSGVWKKAAGEQIWVPAPSALPHLTRRCRNPPLTFCLILSSRTYLMTFPSPCSHEKESIWGAYNNLQMGNSLFCFGESVMNRS